MKRIGSLLITLCMICTMVIGCDETVVTGIYPPISADDCEGMMYEEVVAAFETVGFSNIEYEIREYLVLQIHLTIMIMLHVIISISDNITNPR